MKLLVTGGSGFIGTNLIEYMEARGHQIANIDIAKPADESQAAYFQHCDIMDGPGIKACFQRFQPEAVVHLAAFADVTAGPVDEGPVEPRFISVTAGTQNVLDAVKSTPSVARVITTSTQYVCRPGHKIAGMDDYNPHSVYGEAKVRMEKLTKAAHLDCIWTIIRPTLIWGPWNVFYRDTLFRALKKGYYFQPSGPSAVRAFGYVKNSVQQIDKLLQAEGALVNKKTFYIGDGNIPLIDWMNGYCQELTGHNVRILPRSLIRGMAVFGDLYEKVTGRKFVMYSFRYHNMTDDYPAPFGETLQLVGQPEISLQQGIKETMAWARKHPGV